MVCVARMVKTNNVRKNETSDFLSKVKSIACVWLSACLEAPIVQTTAHLENGQIQAAPGNDVSHGFGDIVTCIAAEQIPQGILQGEPMAIALRAKVVQDQRVVWVIRLLEVAAV